MPLHCNAELNRCEKSLTYAYSYAYTHVPDTAGFRPVPEVDQNSWASLNSTAESEDDDSYAAG